MTDQPHDAPPRKPNGTKTAAGNKGYKERRKAILAQRQANGDHERLAQAATKVGRPSKYRPEYCDMIVADAKLGYSLTGTADLIGVDRATLFRWEEVYPDFRKAVSRAIAARLRRYEAKLLHLVDNGGDSAQLGAIKFGMTNIAPAEYKERFESTSNVNVSLSSLITDAMKTIEHDATQPKRLAKPDEDE